MQRWLLVVLGSSLSGAMLGYAVGWLSGSDFLSGAATAIGCFGAMMVFAAVAGQRDD